MGSTVEFISEEGILRYVAVLEILDLSFFSKRMHIQHLTKTGKNC